MLGLLSNKTKQPSNLATSSRSASQGGKMTTKEKILSLKY